MRLSFQQILLIGFITAVAYSRESEGQDILHQRISIQVAQVPLEQALSTLESKAKVRFAYSRSLIPVKEPVQIVAENEPLASVLDRLLKPLSIDYQVVNGQIMLKRRKTAFLNEPSVAPKEVLQAPEDISVTGRVLDATSQEGLPGVNILVKGTSRGTTTNTDGSFRIEVPTGEAVLVFSFVGYQPQEVRVGGQTTLQVRLAPDTKALEEVVVVGYGTQSKRNVTGSVAKVDMKRTETLPNTNVTQALRGTVAGVQFTDNGRPGQGGSIHIRGLRSITASNDPLIVVDGVFFNGNLADISPNDIESVEVLKDASASAIYGSRAANGVILVTTKQGQTEKPTIRFNTFYGVQNFSHKIQLLTPERYVQKFLDFRTQNGQTADPTQIPSYLQDLEVENYRAGRTIDPWDEISQRASIQSYELSIGAKSGRSTYYLSAGYTDERGLIYGDKAKRITLRSNVDSKVTSWLNVGITSQFSQRDLSGIEANTSTAGQLSPFATLYFDEARTNPIPYPQTDNLVLHPLFDAMNNQNEEIYNNLFANVYAIVELPLKGLRYRMNYSPNFRWAHRYNFVPVYQQNGLNRLGSGSKYNEENFDWVLENILTYDTRLGDNHHLDVTLLYGANAFSFNSTQAAGSNFFNDVLNWNNLALAQVQTSQSNAYRQAGVSSMARLNYRFMERYLLTLTARRDGTSVFGRNNKYGVFPSAALAWIASDEAFLQNVSWLDLLKMRVSYGLVGNQAVSPYSSLSQMNTTRYVYGDGGHTTTGIFPSTMANANLQWEKTTAANLALDFSTFQGRVGGTVEVYNLDTRDLLLDRALPAMTGFPTIRTNVGATNNKGLEITLNTANVKQARFSWNSDFVFSTNRNRIVSLYGNDANNDGIEDDDLGNRWFIGQPLGALYDFVQDGIYQEGDELPAGYQPGFVRLRDLNGDGVVRAAEDRTIIGQSQPKYRWGVTNTFNYGGFSLSVFVNSLLGWMRNNSFFLDPSKNFTGRSINLADVGWWTAENRSNVRPSLVYSNPLNHGFYESRDFVRIQDVSLAYTFKSELLSRYQLASARVYVSSKNLATFTNWTGWDPESGYASEVSGSSDRVGFPTLRSFVVGVNLSF
ncbi:TonB-linked SusC/RagA family outer membrane protein [Rhabdobacter roseus]|uniref:TonB-linked SusC/RagA family outer membrane protein n=2 Tax=Rhabdobacter roseus TaxID=1655419 RepID=A0A840TR90_9BACT|nr:TonB-linked SusC/RagA family outer membrane protein [Rhabdobacter roseus]